MAASSTLSSSRFELEREEQQLGRDGGDLLLDVAEEFLPRRVRRVGGVEQARIGDDAPHEVAQPLVFAHGLGERLAPLPSIGERGELAGIVCLHRLGGAFGGFKIGFERRRIGGAVEILEVPLRKRPELLLGARRAYLQALPCREPRSQAREPPAIEGISAALVFSSRPSRCPRVRSNLLLRRICETAKGEPHQNRTAIKRLFTVSPHNFGTGAHRNNAR